MLSSFSCHYVLHDNKDNGLSMKIAFLALIQLMPQKTQEANIQYTEVRDQSFYIANSHC